MKRATPTPNRFITSTLSWPVKGLTLFFILLALGSCEEDLGLIGSKRPSSRFGVYFKEFNIPVTTVQTDSLRSSLVAGERLLVGVATDPNFGKVAADLFTQFSTYAYSSPKISKTDKTNFTVESVTLKYVLSSNLYVFGDTLNTIEYFNLHKVTDSDFSQDRDYYTKSSVEIDPDILSSGSFNYVHDSIRDHRKRNTDTNTTNNRYDTITFSLPIGPGTLAQQLLDTATANGIKVFNEKEAVWVLSPSKTDSAFRAVFPGFALIPSSTNTKILGIKTNFETLANSSIITLKYSYIKDGVTVRAKYYYYCKTGPGFSKHTVDRAGTQIADIDVTDPSDKHVDFNVSDDYTYLQSGTGLFARLDFSEVHSYFDATPDTILNMAINSAEIIVDVERDAIRHHLSQPQFLLFRAVGTSNSFFKAPQIEIVNDEVTYEVNDPLYTANYYCIANGRFLDARNDSGEPAQLLALPLTKESATVSPYYSAYVTDFTQNFLRIPQGFQKLYSMALIPADAGYGKSLHGLSFKKDKVKLRIYYTKTL